MNCKEVKDLLDAYFDGELDPITNRNIEGHLQECSRCNQAFAEHRAFVARIAEVTPYHKAPEALRARIEASLRNQLADSTVAAAQGRQPGIPRRRRTWPLPPLETPWSILGFAAALFAVVLLVWNLLSLWSRPGAEQILATQLVASHIRSLMVDHLTDVASSDQHTVKPWFDGKLDFAPTVVNPGSDGFPLVGGRIDYLDNRPVAALVYQRRKHFINVFIWPIQKGDQRSAEVITRQGYQLLHWVDDDLNYWAVSDISGNELVALKELIQKHTTQP